MAHIVNESKSESGHVASTENILQFKIPLRSVSFFFTAAQMNQMMRMMMMQQLLGSGSGGGSGGGSGSSPAAGTSASSSNMMGGSGGLMGGSGGLMGGSGVGSGVGGGFAGALAGLMNNPALLCRRTENLRMIPCRRWRGLCDMVSFQTYGFPGLLKCSPAGIGCCIKDALSYHMVQNM